jgi:hypothetical protein
MHAMPQTDLQQALAAPAALPGAAALLGILLPNLKGTVVVWTILF